jgi:hypothetical protein
MKRVLVIALPLVLLTMVVSSCRARKNLVSDTCSWTEPKVILSGSGALGMRSLSIESLCEEKVCPLPSEIEIDGRRFNTELDSLSNGIRLFAYVPLEEFKEGAPGNKALSEWGRGILNRGSVSLSLLDREGVVCSFDSLAVSSSDVLRP